MKKGIDMKISFFLLHSREATEKILLVFIVFDWTILSHFIISMAREVTKLECKFCVLSKLMLKYICSKTLQQTMSHHLTLRLICNFIHFV